MCPEDLYDNITDAVDVICTALQQYKLVICLSVIKDDGYIAAIYNSRFEK